MHNESVVLFFNNSIYVFQLSGCTHKIQDGYDIEKVAKFVGDEVEIVRKNYEHLSPSYLSDMV